MLQILSPLSKFWKRKSVNIYDTVFKLHSKFTVCFLIGCTFFLSANQYFGAAIDCIESTGKYKSQMDHFCWMTGTFISHQHFNGTIGKHLVHYRVSPQHVPENERDYQKYYQWVSIFLMIHALILCVPAYCWKVWNFKPLIPVPNMISPGLSFLNVAQLAEHWPEWSQYFEIYVVAAYNNEIKDRQKLALFLHCLGPDGIDLVNGWFPQLKNFNTPSAMEVTFDEVWIKLQDHCQTDQKCKTEQEEVHNKSPKVTKPITPLEDSTAAVPNMNPVKSEPYFDNNGSVKSSDPDPVDVVVLFSKFKVDQKNVRYISLCDLEGITDTNQRMLSTVERFRTEGYQVRIDDSTISKYPMSCNIYNQLAPYVTSLEISWVSESDLKQMFLTFKNLSHLSLGHVSIVDYCLDKYPQQLRQLSLINCKAVFLVQWIRRMRTSLEVLHLENVTEVANFTLESSFEHLRSLTLIGSTPYDRQHIPVCPAIETLYLDVPKGVNHFCWMEGSPVKSITLAQCWSDTTSPAYIKIKGYSSLRHLAILNKVDPMRKDDIEDLKLRSVEVHYGITKKHFSILNLNDDCLLHLLRFLSNEDWKSLKEVNTRFKRLITPQEVFYMDSSSLRTRSLSALIEIASRVRRLTVAHNLGIEIQKVFEYFTNLSELELTFTLMMDEKFDLCLLKLRNIQKLKAFNFKLNGNTLQFLSNNKNCLHHLDISIITVDKNLPKESLKNFIGRMKNLKTLKIMFYPNEIGFSNRCLPNLEELTFSTFVFNGIKSILNKLEGSKLRSITGVPKGSKFNFDRFPVLDKSSGGLNLSLF